MRPGRLTASQHFQQCQRLADLPPVQERRCCPPSTHTAHAHTFWRQGHKGVSETLVLSVTPVLSVTQVIQGARETPV